MTCNKYHAGATQLGGTTTQNLVVKQPCCLYLCTLAQVTTSSLPQVILSMLHQSPEPPLLIVSRLCSHHRAALLTVTQVGYCDFPGHSLAGLHHSLLRTEQRVGVGLCADCRV
jgi:hypothetical protein